MLFAGTGTKTGRIADYPSSANVSPQTTADGLPWFIGQVKANEAWRNTGAGNNVIVAVLDTGIDGNHPDLTDKVVDEVNFTDSQTTGDVNGHGTMTAGLITSYLDNLKGVAGVAYRSYLLNVKVADDNGFVRPESVAQGIIWATDHGANVINLSLTLATPDETVANAISYAWSKGVVLVAAAGNSGSSKPVYPAAYPHVIGVAATDESDHLAKWSNKGNWVSVSAPGVDITSTLPDDGYGVKSGTSYATALVSGEAALLIAVAWNENSDVTINKEVRDAILQNVDVQSVNRVDIADPVAYITRK